MLKNFCIEPTRRDCSCTRDIRCGGIISTSLECSEHGEGSPASDLMKTHMHPIQAAPDWSGIAVGSEELIDYDDAKAS